MKIKKIMRVIEIISKHYGFEFTFCDHGREKGNEGKKQSEKKKRKKETNKDAQQSSSKEEL